MSAFKMATPIVAFVSFILLAPMVVQAQEQRFQVSFAPSAVTVGGDAELGLGGTFSYRLFRALPIRERCHVDRCGRRRLSRR